MSNRFPMSRRTMLRGFGASLALPLLDAMIPGGGLVARAAAAAASGPGPITAAPLRMAMVFMPNGVHYNDWKIDGDDARDFTLSPTLEPLKDLKDDILFTSGLALDNAHAKGDGPGDHARSAACFLTGAHPRKTGGSDIKNGVSVDQMAAKKIGHLTRLPSLELGLDKSRMTGDCDSGYACAYVSNISWSSETTPMPNEVDPSAVFDRLFGGPDDRAAEENRKRRQLFRKSILDFVSEDAKRLNRELGKGDQRKLDEYTTSIREIEQRIAKANAEKIEHNGPPTDFKRPDGVPDDVTEHMRLMWDLMVLAFQTDSTRVSTMMVGRDGSDRSYQNLGISEGHHSLSHHGGDDAKIDAIKKIDRFHVEQVAYFIKRLKETKEGDGTLLDHCMVLAGAGIGDGNRHNHNDLPIILAGKAGGRVTTGRHVRYERNTPLCNLYLSMLEQMDAKVDRFGDSTGTLPQLVA